MSLGSRIRYLRVRQKLSQKDFSELLGVSVVTLSHWENGKHTPSITIIQKLRSIFGVDYGWLIDGVGSLFSKLHEETTNAECLKHLEETTKFVLS